MKKGRLGLVALVGTVALRDAFLAPRALTATAERGAHSASSRPGSVGSGHTAVLATGLLAVVVSCRLPRRAEEPEKPSEKATMDQLAEDFAEIRLNFI